MLDEKQRVEPPEQHGVDREEVAGDQALGLGMKELPPRGTRASRRGIDSPTLQDRPDAGRRELDTHGGKLTMDPPIAPGRVLTANRTTSTAAPAATVGRPDRRCG